MSAGDVSGDTLTDGTVGAADGRHPTLGAGTDRRTLMKRTNDTNSDSREGRDDDWVVWTGAEGFVTYVGIVLDTGETIIYDPAAPHAWIRSNGGVAIEWMN